MNDGRTCVSVCEKTAEAVVARAAEALESADIVEIRFDCSEDASLATAMALQRLDAKRLLATFRSPEQGGNSDFTVDYRLDFWSENSRGFGSIDLEEDIIDKVDGGTFRIGSYHDFSGVPDDLAAIFDRIANSHCDCVKIAVTAGDAVDGIAVWKLLGKAAEAGKPLIPIAMGEAGKWTRILALAYGAHMTYAAANDGKTTAPGQITVSELNEIYGVKSISKNTRVFGIIGDPVSQSFSPYMQNPAFASAGFDGVFLPLLVKDLSAFFRRMVRPKTREIELPFGGFSVTMPHKLPIIDQLDSIDPEAAAIGAINTVKIDPDGRMTGYNTDSRGFIAPLAAKLGDLTSARVALCGGGGAARACLFALQNAGAEVELFVRDPGKAAVLGDEFGVRISELAELRTMFGGTHEFDILVDATPIGMSGPLENESLFTAEELAGLKVVYDLVTKPYDTPILREAKAAGVATLGGVEMLIAQGLLQFEIWTGLPAPAELMRECVFKRFQQ